MRNIFPSSPKRGYKNCEWCKCVCVVIRKNHVINGTCHVKTCYVNKAVIINASYHRRPEGLEDGVGFCKFHFVIVWSETCHHNTEVCFQCSRSLFTILVSARSEGGRTCCWGRCGQWVKFHVWPWFRFQVSVEPNVWVYFWPPPNGLQLNPDPWSDLYWT
jgi:hypothetical protein